MNNEYEFNNINILLGTYSMLYMFMWILESLYNMFPCLVWSNLFILIFILYKAFLIVSKEVETYYRVI